ncbi:MAG: DNA polymerase subunit beta [Cyanobacteria bacterium]|jgi:predicted nucleotidyltransferase|nr:DNA polymerase subunit beta [Cyanobacteria bacterium GSL.Bin1]
MVQNFPLSHEEIKSFCQRWQITEFALFGSVLRHDFNAESDIDVLVTFDSNFQRGLNETLQIQEELEILLGREVDLIIKSAIARSANWQRRQNILESAEVIYAA